MEDIEYEENEEYTQIYRRSKRTRRKRKDNDITKDQTESTTRPGLNPYIIGAKPIRRESLTCNKENEKDNMKMKCTRDIVKETLAEIERLNRNRRLSVYKPKENRIFIGECDEEILGDSYGKNSGLRKPGKQALDRFRKIVNFCIKTNKIFSCKKARKLSQEETILFFLDTQVPQRPERSLDEHKINCKPLFDMTPFKSIGQKSFVSSVKKILDIPSDDRTEHEINTLLHQLQRFSVFSSYPQHVQKGLCKRGWYSRFERTQIITREGNNAEFYYFILSGVAVSRSLYGETYSDERRRVAEFLRQGDTIGEKEILTNRDRPTTIVCKEPVEVIGLDREIFLDIFKSSGGAECIEFLRSIPELEDFPLDLLQSSHFSCSVHYYRYRRGSVIVQNSKESEWIYVVKSGSCQVYKSVKKRKDKNPTVNKLKRELSQQLLPEVALSRDSIKMRSPSMDDLTKSRKSKSKDIKEKKLILPRINTGKNSLVCDGFESRASSPGIKTPRKRGKKREIKTDQSKERTDQTEFHVKLDIITERECFGLQSLIYGNAQNMSLVSNGAECILISKQFLLNNIDKDLRKSLMNKISPFPNSSQIKNAIGDKLMWDLYKERVISETLP